MARPLGLGGGVWASWPQTRKVSWNLGCSCGNDAVVAGHAARACLPLWAVGLFYSGMCSLLGQTAVRGLVLCFGVMFWMVVRRRLEDTTLQLSTTFLKATFPQRVQYATHILPCDGPFRVAAKKDRRQSGVGRDASGLASREGGCDVSKRAPARARPSLKSARRLNSSEPNDPNPRMIVATRSIVPMFKYTTDCSAGVSPQA
jgi:hypothetical protein